MMNAGVIVVDDFIIGVAGIYLISPLPISDSGHKEPTFAKACTALTKMSDQTY